MSRLPSQCVDTFKVVEKYIRNHEAKIISRAFIKLFPNEELDKALLTFRQEPVKNYSILVFTARYKGEILYRRFQGDIAGYEWRYESPIYSNK